MIAFLVFAVIAGLAFAGASTVLGAGFWTILLWYAAGCWIGFLLLLAVVFVLRRAPQNPATGRGSVGVALHADR